jgi:hypothetical protein
MALLQLVDAGVQLPVYRRAVGAPSLTSGVWSLPEVNVWSMVNH